ncbi:MAG: alpha-amylase family glycosyl hydrolase, partial [Lachnospiraceae bacterium]
MWAFESTIYQIYPLGFCGAPKYNDGVLEHRILKVKDYIPHLQKLGVGAVLFNPLFSSEAHGYDQRDLRTVDMRLGTNDDFKEVVDALHTAGIRVLLDAVFNHVGRGFFAFRDVQDKRQGSRYKDWFNINFGGNSPFNDGFWYEGWEGVYDLVKLNLANREVREYLLDSVRFWIRELGIDGLRLDVAYLLDHGFIRELRQVTNAEKPEFFLFGEALFGDYNPLMAEGMLDSVTNYECYKGMYSSINSMNFFEISYSYNRQFGSEPWCLYRGRHLLSFIDNHDVSRITDRLTSLENLRSAWGMLFAMPGIPCIYYGSEWGIRGRKEDGDWALRPAIDAPKWNELTDFVARLVRIRQMEKALCYGSYRNVQITNRQMLFEREFNGE